MEHSGLTFRECKPEELEQGLRIRNSIFDPIPLESWNQGDPKTAAIAWNGDEAAGFIPLYLREFRLNGRAAITAAFENGVGVKQEYRSMGIGSRMIDAACHFLKGKADALYVYRGDERSQGYRFYAKTGHADLLYMRLFEHHNPRGSIHENVRISLGLEEILQNQMRLCEVFEETYYGFGGFPSRSATYWEKAFQSPIYAAKPMQIYFFRLVEKGYITAYAIAGVKRRSENEAETGRLHLLEMAACAGRPHKLRAVLQTVGAFAEKEGFRVIDYEAGDRSPFADLLQDLNYSAGRRRRQIMSLSFDSKALFDKVWRSGFYLPGIELKVWTERQEVTLLEGKGCHPQTVTLEMKEDMLTRWLMGRLDFQAGVRQGTITAANGNQRIIGEIAKAIPYSDWEYHPIDYT